LQTILDRLIQPSEVAAMIVERVLGEGGYVPPPTKFLQGLRRICTENGILLILDEVQTGFGQTREYFGAQLSGVKPDINVIAKTIAPGFSLGAVCA
jgi:4-aminobutyrate aminotransferase